MLFWTKPHRLLNLVYIIFLVPSFCFFIYIAATIPSFPFSIPIVTNLRLACILIAILQFAYIGYCGWSLWRDRADYLFYYIHAVVNVVIILVTASLVYGAASQNRSTFYDDSKENCETLIPESAFGIEAGNYFCHDSCPCHLEEDNYRHGKWQNFTEVDHLNILKTGLTNVADCDSYRTRFTSLTKQVYDDGGSHYGGTWSIEEWSKEARDEEKTYECSLSCDITDYYLWYDSTLLPPEKTCFSVYVDHMKTFDSENVSKFFAFCVLQFIMATGVAAFCMDKTFGDDESVLLQEVEVEDFEAAVEARAAKKRRKKEKRKKRVGKVFGIFKRNKKKKEEEEHDESDSDDSEDEQKRQPDDGAAEEKQPLTAEEAKKIN